LAHCAPIFLADLECCKSGVVWTPVPFGGDHYSTHLIENSWRDAAFLSFGANLTRNAIGVEESKALANISDIEMHLQHFIFFIPPIGESWIVRGEKGPLGVAEIFGGPLGGVGGEARGVRQADRKNSENDCKNRNYDGADSGNCRFILFDKVASASDHDRRFADKDAEEVGGVFFRLLGAFLFLLMAIGIALFKSR
jgi:hypothetical protein